jgi:rhodanese-related sulfurtransferase
MHKIINALLSLSLVPLLSFCQSKPIEGKSINPKFEKRINRLIKHSIPTLTVMELAKSNDQYLLLDARELEEYRISHIPGAKHIGYNDFDIKSMKGIDKNKPIVLYCSIGYRSEKIGEKLRDAGYTNVQNLFGSIFEWVNQELPVENSKDEIVKKVHTYNRMWSKWVDKKKIERVW